MKEQIKSVYQETADRLKSETPPYFKGIQKIGLGVAGVSGIIKLIGILFPPLLPVALVSFAGDLIGYGLAVAGVSSLTRKK